MGRCQQAPTVCVGKNYVDKADSKKVLQIINKKDFEAKIPRYISFKEYKLNNGYGLFKKLIEKNISPDEIKKIVEKSNLKGKGGAGFPTSKKWDFVLANPEPRYLTINADEGEVGTFKDRHYLELDPHRFLEGVLISAKIINAKNAYIYLRDEYPAALEILKMEINELVKDGLVEKDYILIRRGAGAYICGEESAMIESIEGKRGLPRHRPPYVAQIGLFGRPTLVNNVETVYWIRDIIEKGSAWYVEQGKNGCKGFHSFSVSGRVKNPGVKIAPAGITVQEPHFDQEATPESKNTTEPDYHWLAKRGLDLWFENHRLVQSLASEYNFIPIFIFHPGLWDTGKPLHPSELEILESEKQSANLYMIMRVRAEMASILIQRLKTTDNTKNIYNLNEVFIDSADPLYIDYVHVTGKGNKIVSEKLTDIVLSEICEINTLLATSLLKDLWAHCNHNP